MSHYHTEQGHSDFNRKMRRVGKYLGTRIRSDEDEEFEDERVARFRRTRSSSKYRFGASDEYQDN